MACWKMEISDFPFIKPPFGSGIFQLAMFDYQRVDILENVLRIGLIWTVAGLGCGGPGSRFTHSTSSYYLDPCSIHKRRKAICNFYCLLHYNTSSSVKTSAIVRCIDQLTKMFLFNFVYCWIPLSLTKSFDVSKIGAHGSSSPIKTGLPSGHQT